MLRSASLASCVFLGACATTAPVPLASDTENVATAVETAGVSRDPLEHESSSCDAIFRDLSVKWEARDYWCDKGQLSVRQSVLLASLEDARAQLVELRQRTDAVDRNAARALDRIDSRLTSSEWVVNPSLADDDLSPTESSSRIVFARGRVVLGPRGRQAVASLAQRVGSARRVTLRGYFLEGEFAHLPLLDAERSSVGRSLSVREAWRNAGIDVAAVTILHHSERFDTPHVEVIFRD